MSETATATEFERHEVIVLRRCYTPAEAARVCELDEETVRRHFARGTLAARPDGTIDGQALFIWRRRYGRRPATGRSSRR